MERVVVGIQYLALLSTLYLPLFFSPNTLSSGKKKKYAISYHLLVHTEVSTVGDDMENQDSSSLDGLFQTLKLNTH